MKNSQNIKVSVYNKQNTLLKTFTMRKGGNLWVWLRKNGLPIGSACSGVGVCGSCNIDVRGDTTLSAQNEFEKNTLIRNKKNPEERLACLTRVYENISISADYW